MKHIQLFPWWARCSTIGLALLALNQLPCHAATLWTGPNINWTKSASTPSDTVLPGIVVLTRGSRDVLYNTAAGELGPGLASPANTTWAFGTLNNFNTLTYQSLESMRDGRLDLRILNKDMVMHIISADIYLSVKFTTWGRGGAGTVAYTRSTAPTVVRPTVNITSPASGTVYASPADVKLTATATISGGTVTNVEYFAGTTSLGRATTSPFSVTGNISAAANYSLTAVGTAGGITGTSAPVAVKVVTPVDILLTPPVVSAGTVSFSYTANVGLKYEVRGSSNLFDWVSIVTNTAGLSSVPFSEPFNPNISRYYEVYRRPNP